jgi:D-sedoheptulose 7-phosphate isomerase
MHHDENCHSAFVNALAYPRAGVKSLESQFPAIEKTALEILAALKNCNKIVWFGNGGSAADSQHLPAEFVGRFSRKRRGLASVALTTDTSVLTAIANDYGFEEVFRRQVEALVESGDVVVALSTSGRSRNVVLALELAQLIGAFTVALTGNDGGDLARFANVVIRVNSNFTARVQETHILCGHMLCDFVDERMYTPKAMAMAREARQ